MTIHKKIMLLGDIGVGKTSIARRLAFQVFDEDYKATIGTDLYHYDLVPSPAAEPFRFIVWDTDGSYGEEMFRHVYVREAHAAMIVADVTRPQTIAAMTRLGELFTEALPGRFCGLVLNKSDLLAPGQPPQLPPKLKGLTDTLIHASAKTGENVAQAFERAARAIVRRGL